MNTHRHFAIGAAAGLIALLGANAAQAQTSMASEPSAPWSVSFDFGGQVGVSGDVHTAGTGIVLGLPTKVEARSYSDIHGTGFYWAAGVGYKVGSRGEVRVQGAYTANPATNLQVGTVADLPLFGLWDDYKAFTMDVGYRVYGGSGRARPFVGATVGFTRLTAASATFTVPAADVVLPNVGFFEASTVPSFGVGAGVQVDVTPRMALQFGTELKYHGAYGDLDGLAGTGLESINDDTGRWAMPLTAGVSFRF